MLHNDRALYPRVGRIYLLPFVAAILFAFIAATAIGPPRACHAATLFPHRFSPEHGPVTSVEKPFRQDICLNGLWRFEPLALPRGYKQGSGPPPLPLPSADGWSKVSIRIPSPWDVNGFASGNEGEFNCFPSYPKRWNSVHMGWLKTTFTIPPGWRGRQVYLHFMSIIGAARVVVNGRLLANHFDNCLPFEVDVTHVIKYGRRNVLLVGVRGPNLFNITGPRNSRYTYPTGSFWAMQVVGIDEGVYLQARPLLHVANVFIQPWVNKGILLAAVKVANASQRQQHFSMAATVRPWIWMQSRNTITAPESKFRLGRVVMHMVGPGGTLQPGQSRTFTLQAHVKKRLRLWSLGAPNLYGMIVSLERDRVVIDNKFNRFGWRQWQISGKHLLLNGHSVTLNADSWHFMGVPEMTPRYAWAWYKALQQAHCNAVRLTSQPFPPFFLSMADQMGIAVLDESGIWASHCGFNYQPAATWKRFRRALRVQVLRDRNHACIFGWSVANEIYPALNAVHAPPAVLARVSAKIVKLAHMVESMDPTRTWVSSDGDGDMNGRLPVYVQHYNTRADWAAAAKNLHRPFAVGECTETYYSTPPMVAKLEGDRAYKNLRDYMEGLAIQAYRDAVAERRLCVYGCLWNMVWYGLEPLPLGLRDLKDVPTIHDGIFFRPFILHQPGMQPERLAPYSTTLNPGYDPRLPLYKPWPFWLAVKAACAPGGPLPSPWSKAMPEKLLPQPLSPKIHSVAFSGSSSGWLYKEILALHVPVHRSERHGAKLLIVDAATLNHVDLPILAAKVRHLTRHGGKVLVLNVDARSLSAVNQLLPKSVVLTDRSAASLLASRKSGVTAPISLSTLYFGQNRNPWIIRHGLAGPLVGDGTVLLWACPTNWLAWTRNPEYLKTAATLESQLESKPAGAALVSCKAGSGEFLISTIRFAPDDWRRLALLRDLLVDMRVAMGAAGARNESLLVGVAVGPENNTISSTGVVWYGTASLFSNPGARIRADGLNIEEIPGSSIEVAKSGQTVSTTHITDGTPASILANNLWSSSSYGYVVGGLAPGRNYQVNLDFAETYYNVAVGSGARAFDVSINGKHVLTGFNVQQAALRKYGHGSGPAAFGSNEGITESFRIAADGKGQIRIDLAKPGGNNNPVMSAFSIAAVPPSGGKRPLR